MKFWSSLPLIVAIAFFGTTLASCDAPVDVETDADEEVADDEEYADEEGDEEYADEELYSAEFTLVNETSRPILEFYVSPPESDEWGDDIIPEDVVLEPGEEATITITDAREGCDYDILGVLGAADDGSVGEGELIHSGVEICDGAVYTYSESE
ncbi:MAG: hypothetical protein AAGG51_29925 [Cyanobacteria bacterium P01_G01_bin.54]